MTTHVRGQRRNHRLYPGASQPCHNAKNRKLEAKERQTAWANLTPSQQLAELDRRLGKGVGAAKQRSKLMGTSPTYQLEVTLTEAEAVVRQKAKDRRAEERAKRPNKNN